MCGICGCTDHSDATHPTQDRHEAHHHHPELIQVEKNLLAKNNQFANTNRDFFLKQHITALNLMSSPGSGKTTLLAKTFADLNNKISMAVIVGDQQTNLDSEKLQAAGAHAIQINTGQICHLDAHMVGHAIEDLGLTDPNILFIENIGNLVCPALFDLGETYKVVLLSVTEGDNKPLKYPEMFHHADLIVLTKIDLLPYVDFNIDNCIEYAKRLNPSVKMISLSATSGLGLDQWYQWLTHCQPSPHTL